MKHHTAGIVKGTKTWLYTETSKLSLEAQLNIEVDRLAEDFETQYSTYNPIVPLLLASPAVLTIRGISITNQYRHKIHIKFLEPRYILSKLREKFEWDDKKVTKDID